jgi:hypothetical protein
MIKSDLKLTLIKFEEKWYVKEKGIWFVYIESEDDWEIIEQQEIH